MRLYVDAETDVRASVGLDSCGRYVLVTGPVLCADNCRLGIDWGGSTFVIRM